MKIQGRSRGRPSSMHAVAHPQSLSPVGHEKRLPFHCASVWILVLLRVPCGTGGPWPQWVGASHDRQWPVTQSNLLFSLWAMGKMRWAMAWHGTKAVGLVAVAFCSKLQQQRYLPCLLGKVPEVPVGTSSRFLQPLTPPNPIHFHPRPLQSPTPTTHPHPHHPSSPLALLLQLQLHCTAATAAVTLGASLVPLSSPSQVVSSLGLPSLVLCFSIPRRTASGRVSRFPLTTLPALLLHFTYSSYYTPLLPPTSDCRHFFAFHPIPEEPRH